MTTKQLCRKVSKTLIGDSPRIRKNKDKFFYLIGDESITIPRKPDFSSESEVKIFEIFKEKDFGNLHPFLSSFIHELGHYATMSFFTEDEIVEYSVKTELLKSLIKTNLLSEVDANVFYHDLEIEDAANEWARDAYNFHKEELTKLNEHFKKKWRNV